jgi:hypothetical protein
LAFSGRLLLDGGRLATFGLALMHGAVRLVASGPIVYGGPSRFGGAVSGQRRTLFGGLASSARRSFSPRRRAVPVT